MTDAEVSGSLGLYLAFGLRVRSDIPLPELPVVADRGAPADVDIRVFDAPVDDAVNHGAGVVDVADDIAMLWWRGIGRFVVSDGTDISVALFPGVDPATLRRYLLGPVLNAVRVRRTHVAAMSSCLSSE